MRVFLYCSYLFYGCCYSGLAAAFCVPIFSGFPIALLFTVHLRGVLFLVRSKSWNGSVACDPPVGGLVEMFSAGVVSSVAHVLDCLCCWGFLLDHFNCGSRFVS